MYFVGYLFRNKGIVFRNVDCFYIVLQSISVGVSAAERRGRMRVSGALRGLYVPRGTMSPSPPYVGRVGCWIVYRRTPAVCNKHNQI